MSEAELHWLKSRLQGGKLSKAEQGQLRFRLPIGLVYDPVGRIVLDPDEAVQEAVRLVFSLFEQFDSALAVVSSFAEQHLRFPTRWWGGKRADELIWSRLTHERVLNILHSPLYAGAYVYGRTKFRRHTLPGEEPRIKGRTRRVKQEDWPIVLLDAHPGYITWEHFLRNQRQLEDNRTWRAEEHRGAVREGPSLLQGIVLCGSCGRRMSIRYQRNGSRLLYECHQLHSQLAARTCQTMRGDRIDQAVVACFLEAIEPAHLEVALASLDRVEAHARQVDQQWQRKARASAVRSGPGPAQLTKQSTRTTAWWPGAWNGSGMRSWLRWKSWSESTPCCPNRQRFCLAPRNASKFASLLMTCQRSGMRQRRPSFSASSCCATLSRM